MDMGVNSLASQLISVAPLLKSRRQRAMQPSNVPNVRSDDAVRHFETQQSQRAHAGTREANSATGAAETGAEESLIAQLMRALQPCRTAEMSTGGWRAFDAKRTSIIIVARRLR